MRCFVFEHKAWLLRRPLNIQTVLRMRKLLGGPKQQVDHMPTE